MALKKVILLRIFLLLVIISAIVAGYIYWNSHEKETVSDKLILYGNVDIRQVNLAFNVVERINQMLVEEGQRVEKGQLLATLDKERFISDVQSKNARVNAQAQVVARLKAGNRPQEIEKARADYEAAKIHAEFTETTNKRFQSLNEINAESAQRAEDANSAALIAASQLKAAEQALNLMIEGPRVEDIAAAEATLEAYKAELDISKCNLADANLYAPSSGIIQNRILEPGDMASIQTPAYILALNDPIWIRAYISETDLGKIHEGMKVKVSTDSYPDKTYDAWIGFISPTSEFTPKAVETLDIRTSLVYQIRVYVNNPENELRMGMPATVTIDLQDTQ